MGHHGNRHPTPPQTTRATHPASSFVWMGPRASKDLRARTCADSGRTRRATPKSNVDTTRELDAGFSKPASFLCAYVYFETEPDAETATKLRTRDESRRIAANIAKLSKPQGACRDLGHGRSRAAS
jgi:hypothetical protein